MAGSYHKPFYHKDYNRERRISTYPHPRIYKMVVGSGILKKESRSDVVEEILRQHFASLGVEEQERLLKAFNETEERKKAA